MGGVALAAAVPADREIVDPYQGHPGAGQDLGGFSFQVSGFLVEALVPPRPGGVGRLEQDPLARLQAEPRRRRRL